jgi:secreted Zn-dependent insulinase-like peptidase
VYKALGLGNSTEGEGHKQTKEEKLALNPPPPLRCVPHSLAVLNETSGDHPTTHQVHGKRGLENPKNAPVELWWKGRGEFALPRAQLRLRLRLPLGIGEDAGHEALRRMHAELAGQVLEEPSEDMRNCGLEYQMTHTGDGYQLQMDGYDEHIGDLLVNTLGGFMEPSFGADEFAQAKRSVIDQLSDTTQQMPYEHAMDA